MESKQSQTKECPFCAETIQAGAIKCRYCGEFLTAAEKSPSPALLPKPADQKPEKILFKASPSILAITGTIIRTIPVLALAAFLIFFPIENLLEEFMQIQPGSGIVAFTEYRKTAGIGLTILVALIILLETIKLKTIYYEVSTDRTERRRGIFDRKVDNLDMFRVVDLRLRRTVFDYIFGIGTVVLITTDKTDPQFEFKKIRNPRRLYITLPIVKTKNRFF